MIRIPRKIKKKIPKGVYCYEYKIKYFKKLGNVISLDITGFGFHLCPMYKQGYCKYLQLKGHKGKIDDQVKSCRINYLK